MKEIISKEKELYFELFEIYKERLKNKHLTYEAFIFERESAKWLSRVAKEIVDDEFAVKGYFPFQVYHPTRTINAPVYVDRIVEQWFVVKYIQSVFVPQLYKYNMACQAGKGPFLTMDYVVDELTQIYNTYGPNFYIFQYDIEGYFDNIQHEAAKRIMKQIGKEGFKLYESIVDSFSIPDSYSSLSDKNHTYGFPKGTLPSQWTGVIYLNDLDLKINDNEKCLFNTRYMDDGLNFFHMKEEATECLKYVENYLKVNDLGIRLHPKKTYIAPISRGFTFCGWRYSYDEDMKLHIRIRNSKKKEMESRLKTISKEVRKGKFPIRKANQIRDGMFAYLSHGTESDKLIKYMMHQYPIPKE